MSFSDAVGRIIIVLWLLSLAAVFATVGSVDLELKYSAVTGKYFWFFWSQAVFAGLTLLNMLWRKNKISFGLLDISVLVFVGYCSVNYLTRDAGFEIKLYLLLFLGMFYVCLRIFVQAVKAAVWFLPAALISAGLVESITGLVQLYGFSHSYHGLYKITGHFFNPGPFSGFIALTIPLAVYYVVSYWKTAGIRMEAIGALRSLKNISWPVRLKQAIWNRGNIPLLMVGLAVLNLMAALLVLPAAMSRSAWMAFVTGVLVVLAIRCDLLPKGKRFFRKNKRLAILALFAGVIIVGIAFAGVYNLKRGSADGRLFLWKVATEAIAENPVFGVGLGNFAGAYGQAQCDYFARGIDEKEAMTADCPAYAFNEFLQIGLEQGIVGLLLFLGILFLAVKGCLKGKRNAGILGAIMAVLVFAFTSYPFSVLPICIAFVALLALASQRKSVIVKRNFVIVLLVVVSAFSFRFLYNLPALSRVYASWSRLSLISTSKDYNGAISNDYNKINNWLNRYQGFLYSYGVVLAREEKYQQSNELLLRGMELSSDPKFSVFIGSNYQAMGQMEKAEEYYFRAYYTLPNRLYPLYLLTKLYHETSQDEKAKAMAGKLLAKEPKVMSTAVREMKEYAQKIVSE